MQTASSARFCIIGTNVNIQSMKNAGIAITSKMSSIFDTGFGLIFNCEVFVYAYPVATIKMNKATHSNILLIAMLVFRYSLREKPIFLGEKMFRMKVYTFQDHFFLPILKTDKHQDNKHNGHDNKQKTNENSTKT